MTEWGAMDQPVVNEPFGDGGDIGAAPVDDYGYAVTMNDEPEVKKPQRVRKKDVEQLVPPEFTLHFTTYQAWHPVLVLPCHCGLRRVHTRSSCHFVS